MKEIIGFIEQLSPSKDTDYAKKLGAQGKEKMKIGLYDKAAKYFDIAIIFDPSLADIYLQKGKALLKENANCQYDCDYSEMSKLFSTAIDLDENLAEAYVYRAVSNRKKENKTEDDEQSIKNDFNKVISLNNSQEATAVAYCYRSIDKAGEKDVTGYVQDKITARHLYNNLSDKTDYSQCFSEYLSQAGMLLCALYDICEYAD